jgi:hypothetical protein
LNLFNYILIKEDNTFDISKLNDDKILAFYSKYPNINVSSVYTKEMKNKVVNQPAINLTPVG